MPKRKRSPRVLLTLTLLIAFCAGAFSTSPRVAGAMPAGASANHIVISEFRTSGSDEYIELYNPTSSDIDINGWEIRRSSGCGSTVVSLHTFTSSIIIGAGKYFLIVGAGYTGSTPGDFSDTLSIADNGGFAILDAADLIVDQAGMCDTTTYKEIVTTSLPPLGSGNSYERKVGGTSGSCEDSDDNLSDFLNIGAGAPRNSSSPATSCGYPLLSILINEVAWAGTVASADDEWIELYNPGSSDIDLTNWRLVADDGSPDITLSGSIAGDGYYLLERGHSGATNQPDNLIFFGALGDSNETLRLRAPDGTIVDTANSNGGGWPAGSQSPARSMERIGPVADGDFAWSTSEASGPAWDAASNLINGTPGGVNNTLNKTPTLTPSVTPSPTSTFTPTSTATFTPTVTPTSSSTLSVVINEVAWGGTDSSLSDDEWIELYNPGSASVNITGWSLKASDGTPTIALNGVIPAGGYFLLERDDDSVVADIAADQFYTGALSNSGETLTLYDGSNKVIDTANGNGGSWPAGSSSTYGSMERNGSSTDNDGNWHTNAGTKKNGKNANGGDILGTPRQSNSAAPSATATPEPTDTPTLPPGAVVIEPRPIINEILARPGFDWNLDGRADVFDEFIEIKNLTAVEISLSGWKLDTLNGKKSFTLPDVKLKPGERVVFYSQQTNLLLSDGGETVRLIRSNGKIYDAFTYDIARAEDQSFCRLPDGNPGDSWFEDCVPTPNLTNTREGSVPSSIAGESPACNLPDTIPPDFFLPECNGYGADIWNPYYWDFPNWTGKLWIQQTTEKRRTYIE